MSQFRWLWWSVSTASTFNEGFSTVETIASSLIDMKLHLAGDTLIDPTAFERETLNKLNMPEEIVMRHRIPQLDIFSSDGYAAGYYSYLWADVISTDAYEALPKETDHMTKKSRLYESVFSVEILQIKKMLTEVLGDVTPRVMLNESKRF
jgi:peptidyl-dipeptidase Dcp